jgi:hypothetical protein
MASAFVDERARPTTLIADDRPRRLTAAHVIEAEAALNRDDRRDEMSVMLRDAERASAASPTAFNLTVHRSSGGRRLKVRTTPAWCCYDL